MRRNLLFYLYPRKGSIWPWHVEQLLKYRQAWNGRRIVTIAVDESTDTQETVLRNQPYAGRNMTTNRISVAVNGTVTQC